jgi:hypothetical protein
LPFEQSTKTPRHDDTFWRTEQRSADEHTVKSLSHKTVRELTGTDVRDLVSTASPFSQDTKATTTFTEEELSS